MFSTILEKLSFLKHLPWKGAIVVLAISFTLATISSIVIGRMMLPKVAMKSNVDSKAGRSTRMKPSLNRGAVKSIVRRNIFNAEGKTGDDVEIDDNVRAQIGDDAVETNLPLKLHGIIYGGDPESGIALIEDTSKRSVNSFLFGDQISKNAIIVQILEDRVVFERDGSREYLKMVQPKFVRNPRKKRVKKKEKRKQLSPIAVEPPPDVYREDGFERDKNKIVMSSSFKKRMLTGDFARVLQDAKAEPNIVGGELAGFKLTRIRQDSIYEKSGLQNEDIVTEINGMELNDTSQAIKMLNGLKNESEIEVRINRGGSFLNIAIEIR